ncbi:MAG TPA: ATP-binding protein [Candidatus Udaeobacter sp.]|jgi:PAS domain S-box-containing protein|nr:ATP-binding protein [Candidatus Udaeobacter sp.]
MPASLPDGVRDLLRRVDEVRGLSRSHESSPALDPSDPDALLSTLRELVEELEHSHRRLIETNVQLVSLREVASHLTGPVDAGETTRTVTRYLCRAFGFPHVALLLVNREHGRLEGTWTHRDGGRDLSIPLELPLTGESGALTRAVWLHRTVVKHHVRRHPLMVLPDGHPLEDVLAGVETAMCVPLERSQSVVPPGDSAELCGERCMVGDTLLVAPPPGRAAERWASEREERQRHCLSCELMPMLGVLAVGRESNAGRDVQGDVTLLESIALSIAPMVENARLTQDLRESERFLEHLLDSMASGLAAVNMRGEILAFNRAAEKLLGPAEADVLGRPFGEVFGPEGDALLQAALEHGQEALREETVLRAQSGSPIPVSLTTSLLRNERRNVYGAIATFADLTPLKRAEEQARQLDRLAALGRFTSSVAHEIRNPLTGIAAGVQYLSRGLAENGPAREHLSFILSEIKRLDRIVQDLFDITHPRGLQLRALPLEQTAGRAIQVLQALIAERRIDVRLDVAPRVPPVPHDHDQLEQVLINLIKNAIEASPEGGVIRVSIETGGRTAGSKGAAREARTPAPGAVIRVEDHGAGIAPEHLNTLFEPFFTTKPGGTGLGLYITHDIVKRHGGALTIQSQPGEGTVFTLELPLDPQGGNS